MYVSRKRTRVSRDWFMSEKSCLCHTQLSAKTESEVKIHIGSTNCSACICQERHKQKGEREEERGESGGEHRRKRHKINKGSIHTTRKERATRHKLSKTCSWSSRVIVFGLVKEVHLQTRIYIYIYIYIVRVCLWKLLDSHTRWSRICAVVWIVNLKTQTCCWCTASLERAKE